MSQAQKKRIQGSTKITIDQNNFKYILDALRIRLASEGFCVSSIQVNLHKSYLERLDQFCKDLLHEPEYKNLLNFVFNRPGAIADSVAYPLARKAFDFIWELVLDSCQVSPKADDTVYNSKTYPEVTDIPEELRKDLEVKEKEGLEGIRQQCEELKERLMKDYDYTEEAHTDEKRIQNFKAFLGPNCFFNGNPSPFPGIGPRYTGNPGEGLGAAVLEQKNSRHSPEELDRTPTGRNGH